MILRSFGIVLGMRRWRRDEHEGGERSCNERHHTHDSSAWGLD
jgi:hypothetical protein